VLGSSPGTIEIIAAGLKNIGGALIQNIADGISFVSDLLAKVDQEKFIQGFIDAEIVVRRLLLATSALGATLVKNAELSLRAASNPIQFGKDIQEAGGFGKFIEKEFEVVERKWSDWVNSEPLEFPDLTGKAAAQAETIAGNLSSKGTDALKALKQTADARAKAENDILAPSRERLQSLQATIGLEGAALQVAQQQLAVAKARAEEAKAISAYDSALSTSGFDRDSPMVIEAAARLEAASNDVQSSLIVGSNNLRQTGQSLKQAIIDGANRYRGVLEGSFNLLRSGVQQRLVAEARGRIDYSLFDERKLRSPQDLFSAASASEQLRDIDKQIADSSKALASVNTELVSTNKQLTEAVTALVQKDWSVNAYVSAGTDSAAQAEILRASSLP
jgi:hypothetical protein